MPYSYPQTIDRREAPQLVRHLIPGALAMAATAGFINSVALGFFRTPVSHMTGAVSHLGLDIVSGRARDAFASLAIVTGFVAGAMIAGALVGARKLVPSRRYGFVLATEGMLIGIATWLLVTRHRLGLPAVAMACGLQNAMSSSYCGLVIRTSHVTGLVTDVGVMLGHWLRHRTVEWPKLRFLAALFLAFGAGGMFGAYLDIHYGPIVLIVPAVGCGVAGLVFWWLVDRGYRRGVVAATDGTHV
ncbi:MAG TPA: YoaK family protein [Candidatus Synoicihabitans sp.]|nr:YoaK family protein [Candidatus Synoicihabitans sp.]